MPHRKPIGRGQRPVPEAALEWDADAVVPPVISASCRPRDDLVCPPELWAMVKVKMFSAVEGERQPALEMPALDAAAFYEVVHSKEHQDLRPG